MILINERISELRFKTTLLCSNSDVTKYHIGHKMCYYYQNFSCATGQTMWTLYAYIKYNVNVK